MTRGSFDTAGVVAFGEHLAARQNGDAVGQRGDDRQIVLDHQDRAVRGDAADELRNALDVLLRHSRHRLVEKQHFRVERQRRGDLQRALAAVGEFARANGRRIPTGRLRRASCSAPVVEASTSTRSERQKSKLSPRWRCSAMRTFSSAVRCGNTAEIWKDRTRPSRAMSAGAMSDDVAAVVDDDAARRLQEFGQEIEAGGLAGAVGADEGVDRSARGPSGRHCLPQRIP